MALMMEKKRVQNLAIFNGWYDDFALAKNRFSLVF
jgi:hypothetical protein